MCVKMVFLTSVVFVMSILAGVVNAADPNIVGWWKFDEGQGTVACDSVGDNNGIIYGPGWTSGKIEGALVFDGDDDYVSLPNNAVTTTEFTLSAWANHYGMGGGAYLQNIIFLQRDDAGGDDHCAIILATEDRNLSYAFASIRSSSGSNQSLKYPKKSYNQWHHYAITVDSNDFIFYIDGVEVNRTSNAQAGDYVSSIDYVVFGKNSYAGADRSFFNGAIDDVRIYNRALSEADILQLYGDGWFSGKALVPKPQDGETGVDANIILRWLPGDDAASHDVYFGTNYNDVNEASRIVGDIDGDGYVYWYDVLMLSEQWLDDPASFQVPADLSGDGDVNFADFGMLANNWQKYADVLFKGNQDEDGYDPIGLELGTTYYWRIDEVNSPNIWKGDTWSFDVVDIEKGPYLLYPGDGNEMTVLWQLDGDVNCTVQWGPNTLYSDGSVDVNEYGDDHQYKYTITGLTPATKYYYRVIVGPNSFTGSFLSAPLPSATAVKFLAYGDTRTNPGTHDTVNQAMVETFEDDPNYQSFTMLTGDWVADGEDEVDWTNQFFDPTYENTHFMQANLPINGCIGNHEGNGNLFEKYWPYPYVSGFYWSFDYGPVHIAVVDQYDEGYGPGSDQLTWLENDLSSTTKEWKFIMLHEPGYSAGGGHDDNVDVQDYIQPLCESYDVDIVFAGHNHYYARCDRNGVKHITTGGGGAPLSNCSLGYSDYVQTCTKTNHFCKIDINGTQLDLVAVEPDGDVIDSFTLTH